MPASSEHPAPWWKRFALRWVRHHHTDNSAALSFYALFSVVPLLLLGVTVAAMMMGEAAARGELHQQLTAAVGQDAALFLESTVESLRVAPGTGPFASAVALLTALYAGSHVLEKLRHSLNVVNGVEASDPKRGFLGRLLARAICAGLILSFGLLLAIGSAVEGFIGYFTTRYHETYGGAFDLLKGYRTLSIYFTLIFAFALILKILPRRRPKWWHAFVGATFSSIIAGSLKGGLDFYLRHGMWGSVSGAALTLLVVLFWLFLSIQAFLAGAEITAAFGRKAAREKK
ncbi:MAG TPA: YihY/virulence factor BrkB family protein [Luteolibacter sp.]